MVKATGKGSPKIYDGDFYTELQQKSRIILRSLLYTTYTISKSKMISRRQGEGDEAYFTYFVEADDAPGTCDLQVMRRAGSANKDSALIYNWN
jgi:hypothetical protein